MAFALCVYDVCLLGVELHARLDILFINCLLVASHVCMCVCLLTYFMYAAH